MEARAVNNLLCYYTENNGPTKVTGRPRGRPEVVTRRYSSKKVLRNFTGKHLCWSLFLFKRDSNTDVFL